MTITIENNQGIPTIIQGPSVSNVDYYLPISGQFGLITGIDIENASVVSSASTPLPVILRAGLVVNTGSSSSEYARQGAPGSGGYVNLPNTSGQKKLVSGNFPYGANTPTLTLQGSFTKALAFDTTTVTAITQQALEQIGLTDVQLVNAYIASLLAVNLQNFSNVTTISSATTAIITLGGGALPFYMNPDDQTTEPVRAGDILFINNSSNTGAGAVHGQFNGQYEVTSVNYTTGQITTSRDTTGTAYGTFSNAGGNTICCIVARQGKRVMPSNNFVVGNVTNGIPPVSFLRIRANSPILQAIAKTTPLNLKVYTRFNIGG